MSDSRGPTDTAIEIVVVGGAQRAVAHPGRQVLIGRDDGCDMRLDHTVVSRRHAEVRLGADGWTLRDLGSRNGMYVGGQRVEQVPIRGPVQVRLGSAGQDGPLIALAPTSPGVPQRGTGSPSAPPAPASGAPAPVVPPGWAAPASGAPAPVVPPGWAADGAGLTVVSRRSPTAQYEASGRIRIGRQPDNDVVLDDLGLSRHHAEIRPVPGGFEVVDLGSRNGTYLNGKRVARAALRPGDLVSVGRYQFVFDGRLVRKFVDNGPVSMVADDLMVRIGNQVLLRDISFGLESGGLLGVIGPSGCGKSTLLRALTGLRPATGGRVRYDGRDLYADYAELRYRIGMVPQDDVLHRQLTVRRALRFSAALRFADDVPRRQRWQRVDEVLATLGLTQRAGQRIDTLSGGQRKRTSVALELLTEPSLLCLDEPTSGLDPALDKEVMRELRGIADDGRTVIVVTHSVLHLDLCDRVLVLCQGGTIGYFGPPDELLAFFGASDYAEVFAAVTDAAEHWTRAYRASPLYQRYVLDAMDERPGQAVAAAGRGVDGFPARAAGRVHAPGARAAAGPPAPAGAGTAGRAGAPRSKVDLPVGRRALHPTAPVRQFFTLCARMLAVVGADRGYSLFLLGLPLALALITRTVPGHNGLAFPARPPDLEAQRMLVVLMVGAAFLGIATAIREIVTESPIYRRERAVGLSPGAYLASKVAVFAVIDTIQVVLFVYLALLGRGKPRQALVLGSPLVEVMAAVALVALASTALGLLVSALVRTTEQTTPVLVVSVMAQLVLSGGLFALQDQMILNQVSWLAPTRWGFAAGASTVNLQAITLANDPLWANTVQSWWRAAGLLLLQAAVLTLAARLALRRLEPGR